MKQTQIKLIKAKFLEEGQVSRNWALQNYISRLGAVVYRLKREGWLIEAKWAKNDYVYKLVEAVDEPRKTDIPYPSEMSERELRMYVQ